MITFFFEPPLSDEDALPPLPPPETFSTFFWIVPMLLPLAPNS